ncbi:MAG TPA: clan AA aspartic protease [Blastocatellia bacterium]|jgi:clan AA aspartic protease
MIAGTVNASRDAIIRLPVRGPGGHEHEIDAVIDTGFNGFLTLPPSMITALALSRLGRGRAVLADGSEDVFDIYEATIMWDGQSLTIEADSADTDALIGMALLDGYELRIQVMDGGSVTIEALP